MNWRRARGVRTLAATAAAIGAVVAGPASALAAPGDLDPTFSGDGVATTSFGNRGGVVNDIAIDSQDRIVAAGRGNYHDLTLARYMPDGSPDPSFSDDGKLRTHFPFKNMAEGVAIDSQGRIVVAGTVGAGCCDGKGFFFARFLPNGRFDRSFSGDGRCKVALGSGSGANDVLLDDQGRIVAAGYEFGRSRGSFAVVRLTPNGNLDRSFDSDGKATLNVGSFGLADSVVVDSFGRIVVGGYAVPQGGEASHFAVARLLSDGRLDPAFSGDGRQLQGIHGEIESLAVDEQDRVVAAGRAFLNDQKGFRGAFAAARYGSDGSLDPSFSGDGKTVTQFAKHAYASSVALDPEGRIVVAGFSIHYAMDFALVRYDPAGNLDDSFGGDGRVETNLRGNDAINAVTIDAQGRIVGGGFREGEFAVARYLGGL